MGGLDITIIAIYFVLIISIGLWKGRREKSLEGYALGNRSLPWWAILASILAAEISAATFLGSPAEGYELRNFCYIQLCIGTILGRIVVGKLFLKPYYQYKVVSIYEYLEKRFGIKTRRTASLLFIITRLLASGTRLYVAGIILVMGYQATTGEILTDKGEIVSLYVIALVIITAATAIYTTVGGIKAVIWTDVIQACILVLSIGSALWVLFSAIPGGWEGALAKLDHPDDLKIFSLGLGTGETFAETINNILTSEYTIWAAFLGSTFITMATHGTDQDMVQRMLTGKDSSTGTRAVILSGLIDVPLVFLFLLTGILVWVYYQYFPVADLPVKNPEVFPYFIMHSLPTGVKGLLIAGLLSTAMGSLSTALNSLATSAVRDWYQDVFRPKADEKELLFAVRALTVAFAVILIIIGACTANYVTMNENARIMPIVLGIFGFTYGGLLGVFLLGMTTRKRGSDAGNLIAIFASILAVLFLWQIIPLPEAISKHIPDIAYTWRITAGTAVAFLVGLCFRSRPQQLPAPEETPDE